MVRKGSPVQVRLRALRAAAEDRPAGFSSFWTSARGPLKIGRPVVCRASAPSRSCPERLSAGGYFRFEQRQAFRSGVGGVGQWSASVTLPRRGLQAHRRAARLRLRHPRLLRARVRHPGAARAAHRALHRAPQRRASTSRWPTSAGSASTIPEEYGGSGGTHARRLPLHGGDLARPGPDRRLRHHPDRRRRHQALRHRRAEGEGPRRHLQGLGRGHRHDRARVRLRRRLPLHRGRPLQRRLSCINGQKVFISNARISDHVLVVCRTTKGENKHEGLSMIFVPVGTDGMDDEAHRHDGRPRDQHRLLQRLRGPRRAASSASRTTAGPS